MASSTNGNASLSACSSADPLSNGGGCDEDRPSPSLRRKPVPTPRNTLKKKHPQPLTVAAGGGGGLGRRASDLDSQVRKRGNWRYRARISLSPLPRKTRPTFPIVRDDGSVSRLGEHASHVAPPCLRLRRWAGEIISKNFLKRGEGRQEAKSQ